MFDTLKVQREPNETEQQATELELIAFTLASLVLRRKNSIDLEWLIRRFREMHDIIREAPIYQEILREGLEQGREQGLEQGLERGRELGLEQGRKTSVDILLTLTNALFPSLVNLLREQVAPIKDLETLQDLATKISSAKSADEVRTYILGLDKKLDA
jgi:predicted transposase YdaD